MNSLEQFDALIIGAGQAGPPLAERLTAAGQRVCLIERKYFGGTCVNTGCMPTKTLVASAYAARIAARAEDYGVALNAGFRIDMAKVKARKDAVVLAARSGLETWLTAMPGCTIHHGHARFISPHDIAIGSDGLSADK